MWRPEEGGAVLYSGRGGRVGEGDTRLYYGERQSLFSEPHVQREPCWGECPACQAQQGCPDNRRNREGTLDPEKDRKNHQLRRGGRAGRPLTSPFSFRTTPLQAPDSKTSPRRWPQRLPFHPSRSEAPPMKRRGLRRQVTGARSLAADLPPLAWPAGRAVLG